MLQQMFNKKFSYCRDSARRWSLITPFKIIQGHQFRSQSKPICDLLLVITANLHPVSRCFQRIAE